MPKHRMMDLTRDLRFRIETSKNDSYTAHVEQQPTDYDDTGALYYVVAVVLIYGLSIVVMIASHIRRNKQDGQLRSYLKEMAALRMKNRREQLLEHMNELATRSALTPITKHMNEETSFQDIKRIDRTIQVPSPSTRLTGEADEDSYGKPSNTVPDCLYQ
ncbi:hypothetical protein MAR_036988 [Mya arenaria]|uniref:Uncharacterized protein n=1 Tax=Mya arenaria TaxID=6604 RepID=A0ABY7FQ82_MYAAR|nr:hypothetical protein MAR_036988 [Mya arenaria]